MITFEMQMQNYKAAIKNEMKHTYLDQYVATPKIDDEKLGILISIMEQADISSSEKDRVIKTTMLVQIALDTHDRVIAVTKSNEGEKEKKQKQLSVLAGDYYSGLYYLLLANNNHQSLVKVLAQAIREINEAKMNLYYFDNLLLEQYVAIFKQIDVCLYTHVANFYGLSDLEPLIADWILFTRLHHEQAGNTVSQSETMFFAFPDKMDERHHELEMMYQAQVSNLNQHLASLSPSHALIHDYIDHQLNTRFTISESNRKKG